MDIVHKICRDEKESLDRYFRRIKSRYYNTPERNWVGNGIDTLNIMEVTGRNYGHYQGITRILDINEQKAMLKIELKNLAKFNMFQKGERSKILKLVNAGGDMMNLAKVIINMKRNKRIKKYGRKIEI